MMVLQEKLGKIYNYVVPNDVHHPPLAVGLRLGAGPDAGSSGAVLRTLLPDLPE